MKCKNLSRPWKHLWQNAFMISYLKYIHQQIIKPKKWEALRACKQAFTQHLPNHIVLLSAGVDYGTANNLWSNIFSFFHKCTSFPSQWSL